MTLPRQVKGSAHVHAKLTPGKVQSIRLFNGLGMSQGDLARFYGVSIKTIHNIVWRKKWAHVL